MPAENISTAERLGAWTGQRYQHLILARAGLRAHLAAESRSRERYVRIARAVALTGALGLVATGSVAIIAAFVLTGAVPTWWKYVDAGDKSVIEAARRVHNGLTTEMHRSRKGVIDQGVWHSDEWRIALGSDAANAWLAAEMRRWLEEESAPAQWLDEVENIQVSFKDGKILVGVSLEAESSQVLWATLHPRIDENGSLWMRASMVHVGRLPLPAGWVLDRAVHDLDVDGGAGGGNMFSVLPDSARHLPELRLLLSMLRGDRPIAIEPSIRLLDGRRVRLLDIHPVDDRLEIACRTERRTSRG